LRLSRQQGTEGRLAWERLYIYKQKNLGPLSCDPKTYTAKT